MDFSYYSLWITRNRGDTYVHHYRGLDKNSWCTDPNVTRLFKSKIVQNCYCEDLKLADWRLAIQGRENGRENPVNSLLILKDSITVRWQALLLQMGLQL